MFEHREHDPQEMQVMSATGDPDTMYYHQAMRQPDSKEFLKAVKEEFQGMLDNQVLSFLQYTKKCLQSALVLKYYRILPSMGVHSTDYHIIFNRYSVKSNAVLL